MHTPFLSLKKLQSFKKKKDVGREGTVGLQGPKSVSFFMPYNPTPTLLASYITLDK